MRIRTVLLLSTLLGICISLSAQVPTSSQNYIQEVGPLVDDLSYTYDGTKLRVTHIPHDGSSTRTDYCENITYENGTAIRAQFDGGYATLPDGNLHYYVKDHLGSNRLVVSSSGQIEERNDYYPYGGLFSDSSSLQPYKYNGKEQDGKFGLNLYDYGARFFDSALGRWSSIDPLSEKYYSFSPYLYCLDNPIYFFEDIGKEPTPAEAARIAAHVYQDSNVELIGGWRVSKENHNLILNENVSGFKSQIYERTKKNGETEYVYATAGTDISSIKDWASNFLQLIALSPQHKLSAENAKNLSKALSDKELNFVGHSLGGGMAALNSFITKRKKGNGGKAITFNAAGITNGTKLMTM